MSLTGEIDDGIESGGSTSTPESGDSSTTEVETDQHVTPEVPDGPRRVIRNRSKFRSNNVEIVAESNEKDRYLITYADLITLLLGLFIILYAVSTIDIKKYERMIDIMNNVFGNEIMPTEVTTGGEQFTLNPIEQLKGKLKDVIQEHDFGDSFTILENDRGVTLRIQEDIIFPSGNSELNNNFKNVLTDLAIILKKVNNDIRVEGHTDNIPIATDKYPSNWHLSVARALNTAYFLINDAGMSPDKVSIVGYSEYRPVAPNFDAAGRAKNRRVDIVIIK